MLANCPWRGNSTDWRKRIRTTPFKFTCIFSLPLACLFNVSALAAFFFLIVENPVTLFKMEGTAFPPKRDGFDSTRCAERSYMCSHLTASLKRDESFKTLLMSSAFVCERRKRYMRGGIADSRVKNARFQSGNQRCERHDRVHGARVKLSAHHSRANLSPLQQVQNIECTIDIFAGCARVATSGRESQIQLVKTVRTCSRKFLQTREWVYSTFLPGSNAGVSCI